MGLFSYDYFRFLITKIYYFIKRNKKVFSFIVVLFCCLVLFCSSSFGYIDTTDWDIIVDGVPSSDTDFGLFNLTLDKQQNTKMMSVVNALTESSQYKTGNYYYFAFYYPSLYSTTKKNIDVVYGYLINKSVFDNRLLDLRFHLTYPLFSTASSQMALCYLSFYEGFYEAMSNTTYYTCYADNTTTPTLKVTTPGNDTTVLRRDIRGFGPGLLSVCSTFNLNSHYAEIPFYSDIPYQITYENNVGLNIVYLPNLR